MKIREKTKLVKNHSLSFGKSKKVLIQSMCDIKTSRVDEVVKQINACEKLGADLMRVSVLDELDAYSIKKIKNKINIPLVCDIHYSYKLAILAIQNGADKIRINPDNLINLNEIKEIIKEAKKYDVIIRLGINKGSSSAKNSSLSLVNKALKWIKFFENNNFKKLVISIKTSDPIETYEVNKLLSTKTNYPIHLGVTESGFDEIGINKSISALAPLLLEGIGNTIRISLSQDPYKEVKTARQLLKNLKIDVNYPNIISCPTCGRCKVNNIKKIANDVYDYLLNKNKNITVAIMGCVVNGIGEGKSADLGIAGGNKEFIIFKKGIKIDKASQKDVLKKLFKYIDDFK